MNESFLSTNSKFKIFHLFSFKLGMETDMQNIRLKRFSILWLPLIDNITITAFIFQFKWLII